MQTIGIVERVARAIATANEADPDADWQAWTRDATAAIEVVGVEIEALIEEVGKLNRYLDVRGIVIQERDEEIERIRGELDADPYEGHTLEGRPFDDTGAPTEQLAEEIEQTRKYAERALKAEAENERLQSVCKQLREDLEWYVQRVAFLQGGDRDRAAIIKPAIRWDETGTLLP